MTIQATTLTLDFFDTDLVVSADYLFDQLETIPCQDPPGTGAGMLSVYHARLVIAVGRIVRLSKVQNPESFDDVVGYFNVPENSASNVAVGAFVLRDALYVTQEIGLVSNSGQFERSRNLGRRCC
jgi:hypothetical protein